MTHNQSSAEFLFLDCRGLAQFSFSFYDRLLIYDWTTYIASRRTYIKHIRCLAMGIIEPRIKHLFLCCCIYTALHRKGRCPIVARIRCAGICVPSRCLEIGPHATLLTVCSITSTSYDCQHKNHRNNRVIFFENKLILS
jgi:hypothetical protein